MIGTLRPKRAQSLGTLSSKRFVTAILLDTAKIVTSRSTKTHQNSPVPATPSLPRRRRRLRRRRALLSTRTPNLLLALMFRELSHRSRLGNLTQILFPRSALPRLPSIPEPTTGDKSKYALRIASPVLGVFAWCSEGRFVPVAGAVCGHGPCAVGGGLVSGKVRH